MERWDRIIFHKVLYLENYCNIGERVLERKVFTFLFILLLTISFLELNSKISTANPGTIRVPYDYTTIQEAINHANPGDTILVSAGTYIERIVINKTITLIGESAENTTIDGNKQGIVINITTQNVQIKGFTIQNGASYVGIWVEDPTGQSVAGVRIEENILTNNYVGILFSRCIFSEINKNIFVKNQYGIRTTFSSLNTIQNNIINSSLFYGIHLHSYSENNTLKLNTLYSNKYGILLDTSKNNYLYGNIVSSQTSLNGYGIRLTTTTNTEIIGNTLETNYYGIVLWESSTNNTIYYNNFIENSIQQYHSNTPLTANTWDTNICPGAKGNYWSDYKGIDDGSGVGRWGEPRAASDGVGDTLIPHQNVDYYPLMHPWSPWPIASFTYYPEPPYASETVTFDASTSYGDIIRYEWDFGDGAPKVIESDPVTTHVFNSPGNYTVTLTVTNREGLMDATSKLVTVLPFRLEIDVYTSKEPFSGKGPNMPSDAFAPQEEVILYANVTYNDSPVPDKTVYFSVYEPDATEPFIYRSNSTDGEGCTEVSFRLSTTPPFGTYRVLASVEVSGNIVQDTLTFKVGWIVEIMSIETVDSYGNPSNAFRKGETVHFSIILENIAFTSKNVTLTMVIYDEKETPIGVADIQLRVDPGWMELPLIISIDIPGWSVVGTAQAFSNAYTDFLWMNGTPYCPEKSASILIYS
jgi:parallel beta-helix repeat protein